MAATSPTPDERLRTLSALRGEDVKTTRRAIAGLNPSRIPARIPPAFLAVRELDVTASGVEDGLPFVDLARGRRFYGLPQPARIGRIFDCLGDLLPAPLRRECLLVARDACRRYADVWVAGLVPAGGGTVLEVGAYHGLKAIRFHDEMRGRGRVVAIEIMPENARILERNVAANGLADRVVPVAAGAWNRREQRAIRSDGRQKNAVEPIDGRAWSAEADVTVQLDTLDHIIEQLELDRVDLVNLQVNGAEDEALAGLAGSIDRVRLLRVVAPYARHGVPSLDVCERRLAALGCRIIGRRNRQLIAAPEAHADAAAWVRERLTDRP